MTEIKPVRTIECPIEAVAEAWASIDGKLETYREEKGLLAAMPPSTCGVDMVQFYGTGTYAGYFEEALELIKRIEARGFTIIPVTVTPEGEASC